MNKSFDISSSEYHLPKITKINELSNINTSLHTQRNNYNNPTINQRYTRALSSVDIQKQNKLLMSPCTNNSNNNLTRRLVNMEDIHNMEEYQKMNQKQLLRQHQKLLRVIKKFQQIIDIHLARKKKEIRSNSNTGSINISNSKYSGVTKEDLLKSQIVNNKKIIQNYQNQIKQLQSIKNQRKLNDVIEEKIQVNTQISQLKKDIFNLKNTDQMAGRSLIEDRPVIQRQLKQIQKDLKIELTKKYQYIKKVQQLTKTLQILKKQCQGVNLTQLNGLKSPSQNIIIKLSIKKSQLQQIKRQRASIQQTIQENMVSKSKRNKNLRKDIEGYDKKMQEMNNKILQYKDKIQRYQKVMEIGGKNTKEKADDGRIDGK